MVSPFLGEYLPNKSFRLNWTGDGEAREKKKGYKTTFRFMRRRKGERKGRNVKIEKKRKPRKQPKETKKESAKEEKK